MAEKFADLMRAGVVPLARASQEQQAGQGGGGDSPGFFPPFSSYAVGGDEPPAEYAQNGVANDMLRKLQRRAPEASIDLHGLTAEEAHAVLAQHLRRAWQNGARVAEVVHGRGAHSAAGVAVLRACARRWLAGCGAVLAYTQPRGNAGATLVLLKKAGRRA